MRKIRGAALLFLATLATGTMQAADDTPLAVAQKLFDAMLKHDAALAKSIFTPGAQLFSVRDDGTVSATPYDKFADGIAASKDQLLERIWNAKVQEKDTVATVWADYDFHRNGEFHHCGIDSFSLVKTKEGWKITSVADTRVTKGCAPSPLGPPKK